MATVSYSWAYDVFGFILNSDATGNQGDVAIARTADGGYLGAWTVDGGFVQGRYVDADGTPGVESQLNTTVLDNQFDPSMALLGNGHNVVSFTDHSSGTDVIRVRILGDGAPPSDFSISTGAKPQRESDVAAVGADSFAVAYTRDFGGGDTDVLVQRYEADGDQIGGVIVVDNASDMATDHASVTGLASGGFVVAWEQSLIAGGTHSVWFQLFDASGGRVTVAGDTLNSHHLIDGFGSINQDIQVAALQDGGFVVAYTDNGWINDGGEGVDITTKIYNADGTARSNYLLVNSDVTGDQLHPTVTVLSNGYFVVGWVGGGVLYYQAYDPSGAAIGSNYIAHNTDVTEAEIAALADGQMANVRESSFTDGDGSSVRSSVHALTRTTLGTAADETLTGDGLRDVMNGGDGDDILDGGGAVDTLLGGVDNDVLRGGAGADVLAGGDGTDTASYYTSAAAVTVDLAAGSASGGDAEGDTLSGIENLSGSNVNDDTLAGDAGANKLQGWGGGDVLRGGAGADTLEGGAGIDTASYYTSAAGVTVDLAAGTASGGDAAGDTLTGIENLSGSNLGNDILSGNGGANKLQGWGGDDVLRGGAGADTLEGGAGIDTAGYYTSAAGVTVDLGAGTASGGDAAGDVLSGIETLSGSNVGNDILTGDAGANKLQGWGGDDVLRGGAGADALEGGAGIDTASYYTGMAGVSIDLANGTVSGDAAGDTFSSIENLSGSQGTDVLEGDAGANVLQGWNGDDSLVGDLGKDTLTGGAGADRYYFTATGDSVVGADADVITDFSHAQADIIDLNIIDANTGVAGNQAFSFIGLNLYTGVAGQLRYAVANGVTTIAGDVNGDKVSDFHITLTGSIALVAADFGL
ncbi:calcium-binding protein [Mycobacterium sp. KBS0706]|uniref:calcium-binding protein n=1 Tax=Mycobacterium sp. KBS0706 TaxID=2578109 RepID=UPI00117D0207|nr:calcium-binding protein [Mycobacterium sp. KBS0706]TSD87760.1 calcium-binding protein [Mycobacterium sp. KBS0706]